MMDLYRSSNYLRSSLHVGVSCMSPLHPDRVYTLVATWLADGAGRPRPVLGLRRHLPSHAPVHRNSAGAHGQPQVRPFVLRASLGERIQVQVTNWLADTPLCLALVDDDYGIMEGCDVSGIACGETHTYVWNCRHAGVYPMFNLVCPDPVERRSLLGVLIVEP
jgi:hypothetical protein